MKRTVKKRTMLLATTVAATLMQGMGGAYAQSSPGSSGANTSGQKAPQQAEGVEAVTVTGIVGSLERTIETKRSSTAIVDAISAEDVGKFPDNNVAESLQRITGVEITRDTNGEGQYVSVRGLPTDFSLITLNGLSVSSITHQPDNSGSNPRTRSFDLSMMSPDFISGLEVYKSSRADLDDGAIGANVNVKTVTPFGIGEERMLLSAKVQGSPGAYLNQNYPDITALYSNTFNNDTLGITVGLDWNKRFAPNQQYNNATWGSFCISQTAPCANATNSNAHMNFQQIILRNAPTTLDTITGYTSLQWKPVESTTVTLDGLYARRSQDQFASMFVEVSQAPWAGGGTYVGAPLQYQTIDKNNVLTTLASPNNWLNDRSMVNDSADTIQNFNLNVDTEVGHWKFSETALYSFSKTRNFNFGPQIGAAAFFVPGGAPVFGGYTVEPGAAVPGFIFDSTFNYSNPNAWGDDEGTYAGLVSSNRVESAQVDVKRSFDDGVIESVEVGAKVLAQDLPSNAFSYYYNNQQARNAGTLTPFAAAVVPSKTSQNILSAYSGPGQRMSSIPYIDPLLWLQKFYGGSFQNLIASPYTVNQAPAGISDVKETNYSFYALANFMFDNQIMPIRGNVGLRYVTTREKINYTGYNLSSVVFDASCSHGQPCQLFTPPISYLSRESSYGKLLPSINLIGDVRDDMKVRFSASKTMTRPTLSQLPPTVAVNVNAFTITQGNANLLPYTSINYDLSYEWYFQKASVFSFAVYDKEMKNFVQSVFSHYNVNTVTSNGGTTTPVAAGTTEFTSSQPVNVSSGNVRGIEADYKQIFDFLPSFWAGFGGELNFTYSEGQLDAFNAPASGTIPAITRPAQPFAGLTKMTYNASLFYEMDGFSALIALNHRDSYLAASPGVTPTALPIYGNTSIYNFYEPRDEVDMQASYNITDNLKVFGDVNNLFNAPYQQYAQIGGTSSQYPELWVSNGRRVSLGVTVRY